VRAGGNTSLPEQHFLINKKEKYNKEIRVYSVIFISMLLMSENTSTWLINNYALATFKTSLTQL
jgi:hypothetical protein